MRRPRCDHCEQPATSSCVFCQHLSVPKSHVQAMWVEHASDPAQKAMVLRRSRKMNRAVATVRCPAVLGRQSDRQMSLTNVDGLHAPRSRSRSWNSGGPAFVVSIQAAALGDLDHSPCSGDWIGRGSGQSMSSPWWQRQRW